MTSSPTRGAPEGPKPIVPVGDYPVGTVLPYAGLVDSAALMQAGWLYCDGRPRSRVDFRELFLVIGTLHGSGDGVNTFNIPDYRGWFQRGVDDGAGRDPEAKDRTAAAPGGITGDHCGTAQSYATALPHTEFGVAAAGSHTHTVANVPQDNSSYAMAGATQAIWNDDDAPTDPAGEHRHEVGGGDPESRPINAYVAFIIRYRV